MSHTEQRTPDGTGAHNASMERVEQDGWTVRAEETCPAQHSNLQPPQTTDASKNVSPCHAVIGARPYCSPEYSPDFHKLGSTLPRSTHRIVSHIKADTSVPLQASIKTRVPYLEKKRLLDKQEEVQEVKQLDEWRPAAGVFTAVLQGLVTAS
ncbi:uncharacterized protein spats1 [Chaetodon auriga]|uniref:uncharacterized protein spats1 n=1 Tax=Chaetodon auriga TaxID=39042 RepID=UPI0040329F8D